MAVLWPPGLGWLHEGAHENEERLAEPVAHVGEHEGARGGGDAAAASSVSPTMADVAARGVTEGERERASDGER